MEKLENFRKRNFAMLLYPEDESHMAALKLLKDGGYKYAAILHDRDVYSVHDDVSADLVGTQKKPHYHVVLKFPNDRWRNAMATELGVAPNYINACVSLDGALRYLIHNGYPEKFQYALTDVFGPLAGELEKVVADKTEDERVLELVETITSKPGAITYTAMLIEACKDGRYGDFRRLGNGVKWLIDEHNTMYERKAYETIDKTALSKIGEKYNKSYEVVDLSFEELVAFYESHKDRIKEEAICEN